MSEIMNKILLVLAGVATLLILFYLLDVFRKEFIRGRILTLFYQRPSSLLTRGISRSGMIYLNYNLRFEEQIRYLFNHEYQAISINDLLNCRGKKHKLPPKPMLIILDNGYLSNYLHIYPIIEKYDFPATVFITPDPKSEVFSSLKGIDLPLTSRQISEVGQSNITIGSHGMSSRCFSKLSAEELNWEISESKKLLEDIISKKVESLAIPANDFWDPKNQFLAKELGYKIIFGNNIGTNSSGDNLLNLRKLIIKKDMDLHEFKKFIRPTSVYRQRVISDIKTIPAQIKYFLKSLKRPK